MVTNTRRLISNNDKLPKEKFQSILTSDFFGMRMIVVSNWLLGVACLASQTGCQSVQQLAARYYFSQFWAEFSIEVL